MVDCEPSAKNTDARIIADRFQAIYRVDAQTERLLSHSKRFLERWIADDKLKHAVISGDISLSAAAESCGCEIDVESLLPVFHPDYTVFRPIATKSDWFLTYLWDQHLKSALEVRDLIARRSGSNGLTPQFDSWRSRNINRVALQLDLAAAGLTHPPVAFELSSGCSVGCWFCGISAKEFKGHATLAGNGESEWRQILSSVRGIVGEGIRSSFCYWATDPLDNPEYLDFIRIFEDVTGAIPQTTTAIPLRNVELTRSVLELWKDKRSIPNRFSVMTLRQLREIHSEFSPEDLFGVEIVLQLKSDGAVRKFSAGRNYAETSPRDESQDGTIACVTGFLINIVEKSIKLISPTMPSKQWPDGYIIYDSRNYDDVANFDAILRQMINESARPNLRGSEPIRIVSGGSYRKSRNSNGILFRRLEINNDFIGVVGDLLHEGTSTPTSVVESCIERGMEPIQAVASLERMWHEGVLAQSPLE